VNLFLSTIRLATEPSHFDSVRGFKTLLQRAKCRRRFCGMRGRFPAAPRESIRCEK
jgi:hypothetical protein